MQQREEAGATNMYYAQMFFVVGHVAIKMLTFIE